MYCTVPYSKCSTVQYNISLVVLYKQGSIREKALIKWKNSFKES